MLILSCSMPKSGSGWFNHLTNDLLVAGGFQDKVEVRDAYGLGDILKYDNCHVSRLSFRKLKRLVGVSEEGNTFCVHTHQGPGLAVRHYMKRNKLRATYIYRDPRDVVLSAYEHGVRERAEGLRFEAFSKLRTVNVAIAWMLLRQLPRYWGWKRLPASDVHMVRYEDLVMDTRGELVRLSDFLGIQLPPVEIDEIVKRYGRSRVAEGEIASLHFHKGSPGRFREDLTRGQIRRCNRLFRSALRDMGYDVS